MTLFEYDERFSAFGSDFVSYDYKDPLNFPHKLIESYDLVIADPPFLSEECLTKTASTIKSLTKGKILICTGEYLEKNPFFATTDLIYFYIRHHNYLHWNYSYRYNYARTSRKITRREKMRVCTSA